MRKETALHYGPRKQYVYFPVSYPSRSPRVHAMRPESTGRTVCMNTVTAWTRLDGSEVTCKSCRKWIEIQNAEEANP